MRQASVLSEQFAKCLVISKKEYNRYIKPFHKEEQVPWSSPSLPLATCGFLELSKIRPLFCGVKEGCCTAAAALDQKPSITDPEYIPGECSTAAAALLHVEP